MVISLKEVVGFDGDLVFDSTKPDGAPRNRLSLAQWLVAEENPLTARVTVNALWQKFFGRGIVKTTEDFGVQGSPPTNQDLLDWLAVKFVSSGYDLKALQKLIVTSATYRQSSALTDELADRDPEKRPGDLGHLAEVLVNLYEEAAGEPYPRARPPEATGFRKPMDVGGDSSLGSRRDSQ